MNPEFYDFIMDQLFAKGAHDVFLTPIIMKKSRPAVTISVLCDTEKQKDMEMFCGCIPQVLGCVLTKFPRPC